MIINARMINFRRLSPYQRTILFAALHSVGLFVFGIAIFVANSELLTRLWVALATLWFFWPVVLVLHSRGSIRRLVISIVLSVVLVLPFFRMYDDVAPSVFGWPEGFSIRPRYAFEWTHGYLAGRAEAKRDLNNGHLALEVIYLGFGSASRRFFRDRYGVQLNLISDAVSSEMLGHQYGYNALSTAEFARRYGPNALKTAFEEGRKMDREDEERSQQRARDLARRVSSIPSGKKVTLESLFLSDNQGSIETELPAGEMQNVTNVVHWIEGVISAAMPEHPPAFDSQVVAELTSSDKPKLDISSSASAPRDVHMQIYNQLDQIPDIRSQRERLAIAMRFQFTAK